MSFIDQAIPALSEAVVPPMVLGTADLTTFAYQGADHEALMRRIRQACAANPPEAGEAAWTYDSAIAAQLSFRRAEGLDLQDDALASSRMYRVAGGESRNGNPLRLLALMGPGDLMTNTPLDFLTNDVNVRLDLLYILPDHPLPAVIPDHDVAFFALGEADPSTLSRLRRLFAAWPRPALNDPGYLPVLQRDALSRALTGVSGVCSPTAVAVDRTGLEALLRSGGPIQGFESQNGLYPCLIRPHASHAGRGLSRIENPTELAEYLRFSFERQFFVTAFHEYRGPDGLYRKSRIAFIDRQPFLCHMAISNHWMVHYLNAGMTDCADKRAEEARAMATFDDGFARRHEAAFQALHERLGFDYYSIDCGETHDGRLLVFEADTAAIVHLMDPADLFPYKQPQMRKVFAAFDGMLRKRSNRAGTINRLPARTTPDDRAAPDAHPPIGP
jgi:hypothetical protein